MGVALLGWGRFFNRNGNRVSVPAPATEPDTPWFALPNAGLDRDDDRGLEPPAGRFRGGLEEPVLFAIL
jgi:hypothetical protein